MGTQNRQRRKAKTAAREQHRRRAQAHRQATAHNGMTRPWSAADEFATYAAVPPNPEELIAAAVAARARYDAAEFARCLKLLAEDADSPSGQRRVSAAALGWLQRGVARAWARGWQPTEIARVTRRRLTDSHVRVVVDAIAGQMRTYPSATIDARWAAQLHAIGAQVWWKDDHEYLDRLGGQGHDRQAELLGWALDVAALLDALPTIPRLCPPPGSPRPEPGRAREARQHPADQRMLDRVRALLAKAEATEFPEEAEAFSAKAQELMARHSIDHALLAATAATAEGPGAMRIGVDNPYESAKSLLLHEVAAANRCQSVWSRELGFATVVGYPSDVEGVELLYTSLLVQATNATLHAGTRRDGYGRSRTRSFRQAFLTAYAVRIGQRLRAATDDAGREAGEAAGADRLLPVLAARDRAVRAATETMFPQLVHRSMTTNNREGWVYGTAAADLASLSARIEIKKDI